MISRFINEPVQFSFTKRLLGLFLQNEINEFKSNVSEQSMDWHVSTLSNSLDWPPFYQFTHDTKANATKLLCYNIM